MDTFNSYTTYSILSNLNIILIETYPSDTDVVESLLNNFTSELAFISGIVDTATKKLSKTQK